jgi:Domain of unknown function (DUF1905)
MSEPIAFDAVPVQTERGHVRLPLPFDPREAWGRSRRHYVTGEIGGMPFDGSVGFHGGVAFLVLAKDFRDRASIKVGDPVHAVIRQADAPPA